MKHFTIYHYDDQPGHVSWLPGSLYNRFLLTASSALDDRFDENEGDDVSLYAFEFVAGPERCRIEYRLFSDLELFIDTFGREVCHLAILDVMRVEAGGSLDPAGIRCCEMVLSKLARENVILLTAYHEKVTQFLEDTHAVPDNNVVIKPADAQALVALVASKILRIVDGEFRSD